MFRLAMVMLSDTSLAEDAVQEVLLKLWKKKDKIDTLRNPEAWCIEMTKNQCLDVLKQRKNNTKLKPGMFAATAGYTLPDEYSIGKDVSKQILHLIDRLSPLQRAIFYLRETEHIDYDEISKLLKITISNVKINVFRYRRFMKEELEKLSNYEAKD